MWGRALVVMAGAGAFASCYAPTPRPGSPCDEAHPCPSALVCSAVTQTCEHPGAAPDADVSVFDAPPDACVECPLVNDSPDTPTDVTGGGAFMANIADDAVDDAPQRGCAGDGGRDVFYTLTLAAPEVYYFDTFGSDFDTSVRVFPGKRCDALGSAFGPVCNDDACGGGASQLAVGLPVGTSCIVVDRNAAAVTGELRLRVTGGGRTGPPLQPRVTGDTCDARDVWPAPCADPGGRDVGFWFLVCPEETASITATTCTTADYTFDTVLYLTEAGEADALACNDDDPSCPARPTRPDQVDGSKLTGLVQGPALGWLVLDGFDRAGCGPFTIDNLIE